MSFVLAPRPAAALAVMLLSATPAVANTYTITYLVSDQAGAAHTDAKLKNAWGIAFLPNDYFWIADNRTGVSTLYDGAGVKNTLTVKLPLPPPPRRPDIDAKVAAPTGMVSYTGSNFWVANDPLWPARFIFDSEDGTISAWFIGEGSVATLQIDNSLNGANCKPTPKPSCQGAVYKGLALGKSTAHGVLLYATNFRSGKVETYNGKWQPVDLGVTAFHDSKIPAGFAPYNIVNIAGRLYVTYGKQDATRHDSVNCRACGYVDIFTTDGVLVKRLIGAGNNAQLNAPWGLAMAPGSFWPGGALLVGNFGNGRINAYNTNGLFLGALRNKATGKPLSIDKLWAIVFTGAKGPPNSSPSKLYFTSGPNDEANGRFGSLTPSP